MTFHKSSAMQDSHEMSSIIFSGKRNKTSAIFAWHIKDSLMIKVAVNK